MARLEEALGFLEGYLWEQKFLELLENLWWVIITNHSLKS
jgi:hypothetical protein